MVGWRTGKDGMSKWCGEWGGESVRMASISGGVENW